MGHHGGITDRAAILGRNLKVENVGKKQLVLETIVGGLYNFFYDLLGEEGKQYIPYLMTVGVYIGFANMIGLFGLRIALMTLCVERFQTLEDYTWTARSGNQAVFFCQAQILPQVRFWHVYLIRI